MPGAYSLIALVPERVELVGTPERLLPKDLGYKTYSKLLVTDLAEVVLWNL